MQIVAVAAGNACLHDRYGMPAAKLYNDYNFSRILILGHMVPQKELAMQAIAAGWQTILQAGTCRGSQRLRRLGRKTLRKGLWRASLLPSRIGVAEGGCVVPIAATVSFDWFSD
jgi:hypothetical protein